MKNLYAIYDRATGSYGAVMTMLTDAQAIRLFQDEINRRDPANILNKHPDDHDLHKLGQYDDAKGLINADPEKYPEQIALGKQLIRE